MRKSPPGTYSCEGKLNDQESSLVPYHCEEDALLVLEGVKQADKPFTPGRGQNVTLREDVADFVELEQQLLAHDLQGAHFTRVLLLRQEDLTIATLANLCEDLEVALSQAGAALPQIGALPAQVFGQSLVVFVLGCGRRRGVLSLELLQAVLARVHVGEEVIVVVEEI